MNSGTSSLKTSTSSLGANRVAVAGTGMVGGALAKFLNNPILYDPPKGIGSVNELNKADIIFICVPTPYTENGCDTSTVEKVVKELKGNKIIVIKSTVIPGTTDRLQEKFPKHKFLFNPEFLTEETSDQDMKYPDRQIIGYTCESYDVAGEIMMLLPAAPFERIITASEAEMVKYYGNTWFATKVVFANQIYDLCEKIGINYDTVKEAVSYDKRIGRSHLNVWHKGYRGYGGKCLPKDTKALIKFADQNGVDMSLLKETDSINEKLCSSQSVKPKNTETHHTANSRI
jgi:UDPglucose 6-dehydrogenase